MGKAAFHGHRKWQWWELKTTRIIDSYWARIEVRPIKWSKRNPLRTCYNHYRRGFLHLLSGCVSVLHVCVHVYTDSCMWKCGSVYVVWTRGHSNETLSSIPSTEKREGGRQVFRRIPGVDLWVNAWCASEGGGLCGQWEAWLRCANRGAETGPELHGEAGLTSRGQGSSSVATADRHSIPESCIIIYWRMLGQQSPRDQTWFAHWDIHFTAATLQKRRRWKFLRTFIYANISIQNVLWICNQCENWYISLPIFSKSKS